VPNTADGDFDFTRGSTATRVNKDGLIETVASGVPRLDYPLLDGVVQDCPTLLLEPTRTNSITYSEDFSDSSWNKNNATVTSNNTTAPDGTTNADKITSTGTAPYARVTFTHSTLTSYAVSIFAKKGDEDYLYIRALALSNQPIASFNLSTGGLGTVNSGLTAEMQNYGNGWYRCVIKYTTTSSVTNNLIDFGFASSDNSRFSSSGKFTYFWGAQIETGSYPTSYIPTNGEVSGVTRSADVCNGAGTSDTFNDSEGVLFAEISALADDGTSRRISLSDASTSDTVEIILQNTGRVDYQVKSGNSFQGGGFFNLTQTEYNKIAVKYKINDLALWVNGYEHSADTSANTPIGLSELAFDNGAGSSDFYGNTKQLMTFNEALTDTELEDLTSWDSFREMATEQLYTIE
jgi:hypothetical protein